MYLGIDLGTSAVKVLLLRDDGTIAGQASAPVEVVRPQPTWSEQDPQMWWRAVDTAMGDLREANPDGLAETRAVGLSGQMHGATLLDAEGSVLRNAILWNDGRSGAECRELEEAVPNSREITGNMAMPGFTAPKLLWVRKHEPEIFEKVAKVLLPKDYVRYRMTGEYASDLSDSAGTLWVEVGKRDWSDTMLEACGLDRSHMPSLYEGSEVTGTLSKEVAEAWGMDPVPVAGGAGDQAAGAIGAGVIKPGHAFISLGTSGVYFVADDAFRPNPGGGVHTFCHAIPNTWHQMAVLLSAASAVTWVSGITGAESEAMLMEEIYDAKQRGYPFDEHLLFLPYLSGERTPHNDPNARGVFFGLTHDTKAVDLGHAVLEGVAFGFADGQQALLDAGTRIEEVSVIGGGAQGVYWGEILATVLNRTLVYREAAEVGTALGAARLARLAVTGEDPGDVCTPPPVTREVEPNPEGLGNFQRRLETYRELYAKLRDTFATFCGSD